MDQDALRRELERLESSAREIRRALEGESAPAVDWTPKGFYLPYHVLTGLLLGFVAAGASLIFNVVGSVAVGQHPLQLIRVYLTFPMGEGALQADSGLALAVGCCLYLGTGAFLGVPFMIAFAKLFPGSSPTRKLALATGLGLAVWLVNFYGILSWLQPAMFGGRWIVEMVPFWVAAATHLVFAWTILLFWKWGHFDQAAYKSEA